MFAKETKWILEVSLSWSIYEFPEDHSLSKITDFLLGINYCIHNLKIQRRMTVKQSHFSSV